MSQEGELKEGAAVCEVTALIDESQAPGRGPVHHPP